MFVCIYMLACACLNGKSYAPLGRSKNIKIKYYKWMKLCHYHYTITCVDAQDQPSFNNLLPYTLRSCHHLL